MKVYTEQQARDASQRIASALGDDWAPAPVTAFEAGGTTGYTCGASGTALVGDGEAAVGVQVVLLDAGADTVALALEQVRQQVERAVRALRRSETSR